MAFLASNLQSRHQIHFSLFFRTLQLLILDDLLHVHGIDLFLRHDVSVRPKIAAISAEVLGSRPPIVLGLSQFLMLSHYFTEVLSCLLLQNEGSLAHSVDLIA